jgi:hypothetical protein
MCHIMPCTNCHVYSSLLCWDRICSQLKHSSTQLCATLNELPAAYPARGHAAAVEQSQTATWLAPSCMVAKLHTAETHT